MFSSNNEMHQIAALYIRVSTEEQATEGMSVSGQIETLTQYCNLFGIQIYKIYKDLGISGKDTTNRPGLNELVEESKKGLFNSVLVWKISRLSRSLKDLLILVDNFDKDGVSFISYSEKFDTSTPVGKMTLQILGSIAEFERNTIIENVKMGLKERIRQGNKSGGHIYGYDWKDKKLIINEHEAAAVKKAFELYGNEDYGLNTIAIYLNQNGYKTKRDVRFTHFAVGTILENPTYIGMVRHNTRTVDEYVLPGNHEPLISKEIFDKVQTRRKSRSTLSERNHEKGTFLISGIARCPLCNAILEASYAVSRKVISTGDVEYRYRYYKCSRATKKDDCTFKGVRADYLEKELIDKIIGLANNKASVKKSIEQSYKESMKDIKPLQDELNRSNIQANKLQKAKNDYFEMFEAGEVDDKQIFAERIKKLSNEISILNARKSDLEAGIQMYSNEPVALDSVINIFDKFQKLMQLASPEDQKKLIRTLVKEVILNEDRSIDYVTLILGADSSKQYKF